VRRVLKWLGRLIGLLAVAIVIFAAFNWTMVRNMASAGGKSNTETAHLTASQDVKGCGERSLPIRDAKPVSESALAQMQAFSDKHKGLGLLVMHDGELIYAHFAKGVTAATRTQSFSMNKSITSLMTGIVLADGKIKSIDEPLGDMLPEWKGDARKDITLRHLLTMSSGLHNPSMAKGEWAAMSIMLSDNVEQTALGLPMEKMRGTAFKYNNANPQIVGAVLRRALGKESYASYLSRTLWCGVGNAPATLWSESEDGAPRFYAGLNASLYDWARIGQMVLEQGKVGDKQVVPADWIKAMTTPSATNPHYGFLTWLGSPADGTREYSPEAGMVAKHSAPYAAKDVIFFDGFGGQRVYIIPSAKLVIARTGETDMEFDDAPLVNLALSGLKSLPK
jgi:CubicO group peptidase (beta-lactamase class C family)